MSAIAFALACQRRGIGLEIQQVRLDRGLWLSSNSRSTLCRRRESIRFLAEVRRSGSGRRPRPARPAVAAQHSHGPARSRDPGQPLEFQPHHGVLADRGGCVDHDKRRRPYAGIIQRQRPDLSDLDAIEIHAAALAQPLADPRRRLRSGPCCRMAWISENPKRPMNAAAITASVVVPITDCIGWRVPPFRLPNCDASGQQGLRPSSSGDCTGKAVGAKGRYGGPPTCSHQFWRVHSRIGHAHGGDVPAGKAGAWNFRQLSQSLWQTRMPFSQCQPIAGFGESLS